MGGLESQVYVCFESSIYTGVWRVNFHFGVECIMYTGGLESQFPCAKSIILNGGLESHVYVCFESSIYTGVWRVNFHFGVECIMYTSGPESHTML